MTLKTEKVILNEERNVTLVTMVQTVEGEFGFKERPGIVILPGGGYATCSDREAELVAYPYLTAGFDAFVLRYSVGEHRRWPNPLNDYEQAMEYILAHADEWHLASDKIAVIGFSAGGHLAASAATISKHRPNAAILGYAAVEQDIASTCQPGTDIPAPVECVDGQTPPCFIMACCDDPIVPVKNCINFMKALSEKSIVFESRIYPYGGHGFSLGEKYLQANLCSRVPDWVQDSIGFLNDIFGDLTANGFEHPRYGKYVNGNSKPTLSTECTIGYLHKKKDICPELLEAMGAIEDFMKGRFGTSDLIETSLGAFKIKECLAMLGWSAEKISDLENILVNIPND